RTIAPPTQAGAARQRLLALAAAANLRPGAMVEIRPGASAGLVAAPDGALSAMPAEHLLLLDAPPADLACVIPMLLSGYGRCDLNAPAPAP
ncbi:MAG: hypothetical protein HXY28_07550, partial [Hydrogenophilaceae bacterium]|nr:hypothetical protein [Hydrogenophilaceae bacterium]